MKDFREKKETTPMTDDKQETTPEAKRAARKPLSISETLVRLHDTKTKALAKLVAREDAARTEYEARKSEREVAERELEQLRQGLPEGSTRPAHGPALHAVEG